MSRSRFQRSHWKTQLVTNAAKHTLNKLIKFKIKSKQSNKNITRLNIIEVKKTALKHTDKNYGKKNDLKKLRLMVDIDYNRL